MMIKAVKQVRAALSLLSPEEIRRSADKPVHIGLVAAGDAGYAALEEFLSNSDPGFDTASLLHRAGDREAPNTVDVVLYEQGIPRPEGAYTLLRDDPETVVSEILGENAGLSIALARHFPVFRRQVVDRLVQSAARENALFAVATALPDIIPSLAQVPWLFGEFASDTAFITGNQLRMAFQIAAASGRPAGFAQQKAEVVSIAAGAFGWRAIARELVGKIPFGAGLIPKGAIAYAATFVIGKGLERLYHANAPYTPEQREELYRDALERGRTVAQSMGAEKQS